MDLVNKLLKILDEIAKRANGNGGGHTAKYPDYNPDDPDVAVVGG